MREFVIHKEGLRFDLRPVLAFLSGSRDGDYRLSIVRIVIDNPPFSIYAQIVRWYLSRGIDFFLFGPQLTLFVRNADVTYFIANTQITYENGAVVNTSFVTNLTPGYRIWLCPELKAAVDACAPPPKLIAKNTYPDTVVTSAILGKIIARGVELKIPSSECQYVGNLDALAREGKSLFGGGVFTIKGSGSGKSGSGKSGSGSEDGHAGPALSFGAGNHRPLKQVGL